MCSATDMAHRKLLERLRSLGKPREMAYRTGRVAEVTGFAPSTIRERCTLPVGHPDRIVSVRRHTCAHRRIPEEEVVRLLRLMLALADAS